MDERGVDHAGRREADDLVAGFEQLAVVRATLDQVGALTAAR